MHRRPARRTRLTALGMESAGVVVLLCAVAVWSWPVALGLGGIVLILAAVLYESGELL